MIHLSSKQTAFLVHHIAQQRAASPTAYTVLLFGKLSLIQTQNLSILQGLQLTPRAHAIRLQMHFAVVLPEKRCSTDSFSVQKGTDLTSFPISFCEVIFSKDSVLKQKPHKDFVRARCSFSWLWLQLLQFMLQ